MNTQNKQAQIRLRALPDGTSRLRLVLIALCLLAGLAQGSTLRVAVKTVTNRKFSLEIGEDATVGDLRKKIDSTAPAEFLNGGVTKKLILNRKTLKDAQNISSLNLGPDVEILCLSKKVRGKKRKAKVAPAQAEEKPAEPEKQTQQQQLEEEVEKLLKMGYQAESIVTALQAANGDVSLAKQYLTAGGIPEDRAAALQKRQALQALNDPRVQQQCIMMLQRENADLYQRFIANQQEVGATDEFSDEVMRMFTMLVETQQRGPRRTPASEEERARDKANVKQLMEECDVKRRHAAQAYLRSGKDLERAKALLAKAIRLTDADSANINKLIEQCAVNRSVATQIYLKNGKDFDRTKAFMDDLMAQAEAQAASQAPTVAAPGPASPLAAAAARDVQLPRAQPEKEPQKQEPVTQQEGGADTVLTITPDMLFGDDSDDEELTEAQGPGMDQVD